LNRIPRGRAQTEIVATTVSELSSTVSVLLFSLLMKMRPVPFASAGAPDPTRMQRAAAAIADLAILSPSLAGMLDLRSKPV
jgi:hypothetical protein